MGYHCGYKRGYNLTGRLQLGKQEKSAMRQLGIRELKNSISEVIRDIRESGEPVEVTYHGQVVLRLVPVQPPRLAQIEIEEIIADMDRVAAELGSRWPRGVTVQDALDDARG
jgi:prevent-host-death family protein